LVEVADDAGDVGFGFEVGRDAAVLVDAPRSGIVGGEGFDEVEVIALEEFAEIAGAGLDVGLGIEGVVHAELRGGLGHELHEALRAFGGDGADIESAFGADDAGDEIGIEFVGAAGGFYGFGEIEGTGRDGCGGLGIGVWSWIVGKGFEVVDFGGGNVDEAGLISVDIETGYGTDDLAALVADGESVAENGGVGGERGKGEREHEREKRGAECELD